MLTAADLAYMRDTQEDFLPGTVVILRDLALSNGAGMQYDGYAAHGTVLGRIYPMQRRGMGEVVAGAQVLSVNTWFATLPAGTDVTARDRLSYEGRTWEVMRVNNDEMWQTAVRCELETHNEENRT